MPELAWMHPNYRDLVIDELASDKTLRDAFLQTASVQDIGLAFSMFGGENGKRIMPLIIDNKDKEIIEQRIQELIPELNNYEQMNLLIIIEHAIKEEDNPQRNWISNLLYDTLTSLKKHWQHKTIYFPLLEEFCKLTLNLKPLPLLPDFKPMWNYQVDLIKNIVKSDDYFSGSEISEWAKLISLLIINEPRFLAQLNFPKDYTSLVSEIVNNLKNDVNYYILSPTKDEIIDEIDRIKEIIDGLNKLSSLTIEYKRIITPIERSLEQKRDELSESIPEEQEPDFEDIDDEPLDPSGFNINQLFSDL